MHRHATSRLYLALIISLSLRWATAKSPTNVCGWSKIMPNGETHYSFIQMVRGNNGKRSSRLRLYHSVWSNERALITCAWNSDAAVTQNYLMLCQARTSEFSKLHDERFNINLMLAPGGLCAAVTSPAHQGRTETRKARSVNHDHSVSLSQQNFLPDSEMSTGERHRRVKRFIMPGTLWCGSGNKAASYADLGVFSDTDSCCREHDQCQNTILSFQSSYGVFNTNIFTMSHCDCDKRFHSCLLMAKDSISNVVGYTFFNVLKMRCFEFTQKLQCVQRNWFGMCLASEMALYADVYASTQYNNPQTDKDFADSTIATSIFTSAQEISNTDLAPLPLEVESTTLSSSVLSAQEAESTTLSSSAPSTQEVESTTLSSSVPSTQEVESTTLTSSVLSAQEVESTTLSSSVPSTQEVESTTLSSSVPSTQEVESTTLSSSVLSAQEVESTTLSSSVPSTQEVESTTLTSSVLSAQEAESTTLSSSVPSTQEVESTTLSSSVPSTQEVESTTLSSSVTSKLEVESTTMTSSVPDKLEAESTTLTSVPSTQEVESTTLMSSVPSKLEAESTTLSSAYVRTLSSAVYTSSVGVAKEETLPVPLNTREKNKDQPGQGISNTTQTDLSSLPNSDLHSPEQDTLNTDKQHDCEVYRDLDECSFRIPSQRERYGLQNEEPRTVYHCDCTSRLFQGLAQQKELNRVQAVLLDYVSQSCFSLQPHNCTLGTSCRAVLAKADITHSLQSRDSDTKEARHLVGLKPNGRRPKLRRTKRKRNRSVRLQKLCQRMTRTGTLQAKSVPPSGAHSSL